MALREFLSVAIIDSVHTLPIVVVPVVVPRQDRVEADLLADPSSGSGNVAR